MPKQTVYTITAHCQDCYRCVRECPVKAIRINGSQAQIEDALCIKCGTCVRECPQGAKTIRTDLDDARALLESGAPVAVSIAPSFPAVYPGSLAKRLPSALRRLGFSFVGETAEGAKYITEQSFVKPDAHGVCTACPAIVNLIEKYYPAYLDTLIPVVSPMIAHARMIKEKYPGYAIIFIGPCAAKKDEIQRPQNVGAVDVVLTFTELSDWLLSSKLSVEECPESDFDRLAPIHKARLFPIAGGMIKTGGLTADGTQTRLFHLSGALDVIELFSSGLSLDERIVEPLFCPGGCVGGPCFATDSSGKGLFERRDNVISYSEEAQGDDKAFESFSVSHGANFKQDTREEDEVTESQINKVFERTGKTDPRDQLNCGACGYKSCVENAAAVVRGMAEPEMCMPYMRRLAQQRTDRIIDTTPNGIVVLDSKLCIIKMNPAFQAMFMCNNGILGRRVSYLVSADGFERLQSGAEERNESIQTKYGIKYHEILYALREEEQYVGIYADISKVKYDTGQLNVIKSQTLLHAREFLDHQMRFAQDMAHYLGKSAARSEEIAKRLIGLYEEESDGGL